MPITLSKWRESAHILYLQTNTDVDFTLHEDKWYNMENTFILVLRMIQYFVVAL